MEEGRRRQYSRYCIRKKGQIHKKMELEIRSEGRDKIYVREGAGGVALRWLQNN
jgi:hypothetical protein